MGVLLFLTMRVLHVALAGAWFGAAVLTASYLLPAVGEMRSSGPPVVAALVRRGLVKYMASVGGITIVTGIYLFWRFTGGFDPAVSASRAGIAYSVGALTGLIALILGGRMVGGSAKKLSALDAQIAGMPDGPSRVALTNQIEALRARMATFARIVAILLLISMATMALGHYI